MRQHSFQWRKALESQPCASRESILRIQKRYRRNSSYISWERNTTPAGIAFDLAFALLSEEPLRHLCYVALSRLQTKRRASLFWLEGRAKAYALKAYDSPDKHTPRRHPKLLIGYRLASRVLSVCRVVVLRDRFATDGRSCRPLRGGSRRGAMRSDAFPFLTVSIIPKATAFRERLLGVVAGFQFLCALCVLCG